MADIQDLLDALENIGDKLDRAAPSGPGGGGGGGPDPGGGSWDESSSQMERRNKALQKELELLAEREAAIGRLTAAEKIKRQILENNLKLDEEIQDIRAAAVNSDGTRRDLTDEEIAQIKSKTKATKKLNASLKEQGTQMGAGALKSETLRNSLFGLTGDADKLKDIVSMTGDEFIGWAEDMGQAIATGKIFHEIAVKIAAESFNLATATDKTQAAFRRMTGAADSAAFGHYAQVISDTRDQTAIFGATHAQLSGQMGALYDGFSDFTTLNESQKQEILGQTAALDALSVSAQTSAQIFDRATKSLGYNEDELVGLTEELHATAQSLGKSTASVFRDFNQVSKQLAFYGKDTIDVFKHLEKQSKATGLSTSELVSISGKAFDTFDGAATKVGKLNAILGGPYLNSIDMLNATEAERIDMLKQSMDMAGQTYSELNKFEQLAIADALGVDVDTARRMFGELSAAEELEIRNQEKIAETAREAQSVMDKLKNAFMSLIVAMDIIIQPIAWVVEGFSWLIGLIGRLPESIQKLIKGTITAVATFFALTGGLKMLGLAFQKFGVTLRRMVGPGSKLYKLGFQISKIGRALWRWQHALVSVGRALWSFGKLALKVAAAGTVLGLVIWAAVEALIFSLPELWQAIKGVFGLIIGIFTLDGQKIKDSFKAIFDGLAITLYKFLNILTFGLLGFIIGFSKHAETIKKVIGGVALAIGIIFSPLGMAIAGALAAIAPFIATAAAIVGALIAAWYLLKAAIWVVKKAWDLFVLSLTPLIFAVKLAIEASTLLWGVMKDIASFVVGQWVATFKLAVAALTWMWGVMKDIGAFIANTLLAVWGKMKQMVMNALEPMITAWGKFQAAIGDAWNRVKEAFAGLRAALGPLDRALLKAWTSIKTAVGALKDAFGAIWESIKAAMTPIMEAFAKIKAQIWGVLEPIIDKLLPVLKTIGMVIGGVLLGPSIAGFLIFIGILKVFAGVVTLVLNAFVGGLTWVADTIVGIVDKFTAFIELLTAGIEAFAGFVGGFAGFVGGIAGTIGGWFGDGGDAAPEAENVGDVIITASGKVLKPDPQDIIMAAKPDGPIAEAGALFGLQYADSDPEQEEQASLGKKFVDLILGPQVTAVGGAAGEPGASGPAGAPGAAGAAGGAPVIKIYLGDAPIENIVEKVIEELPIGPYRAV